MSLSLLLFLAHLVARALALVGGRRFARVARKGTVQHEHLKCVVRRLHAKGKLGRHGEAFCDVMKRLVHVVAAIAHFAGPRATLEPCDRAGAYLRGGDCDDLLRSASLPALVRLEPG